MRSLVILFAFLSVLMPVAARQPVLRIAHADKCAMPAHAHRYSDVRMVRAEVKEVDKCGFSFIDTEENTFGADHYLQFSDDFALSQMEPAHEGATELHIVKRLRKDVKPGLRGIAYYCQQCKLVFSLRAES